MVKGDRLKDHAGLIYLHVLDLKDSKDSKDLRTF